jgi:hypothetical protein
VYAFAISAKFFLDDILCPRALKNDIAFIYNNAGSKYLCRCYIDSAIPQRRGGVRIFNIVLGAGHILSPKK